MTRIAKPPLKAPDAGLGGLLVHMPTYGIIICRACRFAIQPSAFSSHLQNHHILRSERRSILASLSQLRLPSPDHIGVPPSHSQRIPDLDLLDGFKCQWHDSSDRGGCHYACTSLKRMSQHWSDLHRQPDSKAVRCRGVKLQTFFRGNKIRYFEVEGPEGGECWSQKDAEDRVADPSIAVENVTLTKSPVDQNEDADALGVIVERGIPQPPPLDYQSLQYLHHYIRHVGCMMNRGNESSSFWLDDVVFEAHAHPFLMYSLLCVAAIDKARHSTASADERKRHLHASASYCAGAIVGYRAAVVSPTRENSTALVACSRLMGQQEIVRDLIKSEQQNCEFDTGDIVAHLVLLQGCGSLMLQLRDVLPPESPFRMPDEVLSGLKLVEAGADSSDVDVSVNPGYVAAEKWDILETLETKLDEADLLPEDERPMIRGVIRVLTVAIIHAYGTKTDGDAHWAEWNAVEGWLRSPVVADQLLPALRECRPAALVMCVSWVVLLLKRLEGAYAWMQGLGDWFVRVAVKAATTPKVGDVIRELLQ